MSGASRQFSSTDGSTFLVAANASALSRMFDNAGSSISNTGSKALDMENVILGPDDRQTTKRDYEHAAPHQYACGGLSVKAWRRDGEPLHAAHLQWAPTLTRQSPPKVSPRRLIGREAIEQAVTARAAQVCLAAATFRSTRRMGGVPRPRGFVIAQTLAVDMADH